MKADELQEQVFALVRKQVWHLRRPVLTPTTHLAQDLGLDAVGRVQLGIRLEYGRRTETRDTELGQWATLAGVRRPTCPLPPISW